MTKTTTKEEDYNNIGYFTESDLLKQVIVRYFDNKTSDSIVKRHLTEMS